MIRRTVIVEGPLALNMRRIAAAREAEAGVQIMSLPQLAARLAGGFTRPARSEDLDPAIQSALEAGGFAELESIRSLPGMTRSVAWTLTRLWDADYILADRDHETARLRDLMTIEARVRACLPRGVLSPPDLRNAALQRVTFAPAVLGSVELHRVVRVAPIWRPLLTALGREVRVTWRNPGDLDAPGSAASLSPIRIQRQRHPRSSPAPRHVPRPSKRCVGYANSSRRAARGQIKSPCAPRRRRTGTTTCWCWRRTLVCRCISLTVCRLWRRGKARPALP